LQGTPFPLNKEASGETPSNHHSKENFAILKNKKTIRQKSESVLPNNYFRSMIYFSIFGCCIIGYHPKRDLPLIGNSFLKPIQIRRKYS
jgi:hypothetical protein